MKSSERDLLLGEMHSDIKNIKTNVEKMNGGLRITSERSIRNEVKINRFWKISGSILAAVIVSLVFTMATFLR